MKARKVLATILALLVLYFIPVQVRKTEGATAYGTTERVSIAPDGQQGNGGSICPSASGDGRYIAFSSAATNLVSNGNNGYQHIFVHDRQTGQNIRVSVASDGTEGNQSSYWPSISTDGRYITFYSSANNLVNGDTSGYEDIFVHDIVTGETVRASVSSEGIEGNGWSYLPSISSDGRYIAFRSAANNLVNGDTNNSYDIFVYDRQTRQINRVSTNSTGGQGNRDSYEPSISGDGRYVAFSSLADNLVANDTNGYEDVFVHDLLTGSTSRVSVSSNGDQANGDSLSTSISQDGRYVVFASAATNLVNGDTNNRWDIFLHDRQTGSTARVSVASDGTQGNNDSPGDITNRPSISSDGRYVTFGSYASNLVSGDTNGIMDIFVHDVFTGQTTRVSTSSSGIQGNDVPMGSSISADGQHVAFASAASNLVVGDTNGTWDIFVHDMGGVSYSISGRVTDGTSGLSGTTISTEGSSTTTDASGYYTITNVVTGTYTLTASKSGYTFSPTSRNVSVPPSKTGQDFVGSLVQQTSCGVPFLSQRDGRWINYPLRGSCSSSCNTIGTCGCVLTSATMVFDYYGAGLTPPNLSDCLGNNACPFSWSGGASCSSGKASLVGKWPFDWNTLSREVSQNKRPVVLGMHRKTDANSTHWVTVVSGQGSSPGNYTIHDPWFLAGANMGLAVRSNDYNFDWIASYSGQPSCTTLASQTTTQQKRAAVRMTASNPVTGNVWIYNTDGTTMTLLLVAESNVANVTEMQIWTDAIPTTWQPFTTLANVPVSSVIHARFRDELGNASDTYTDTFFPVNSPPKETMFKIYLPIIRK